MKTAKPPIKPGRTYRSSDGTRVKVTRLSGRGRHRAVHFENLSLPCGELWQHIHGFRARIVREEE